MKSVTAGSEMVIGEKTQSQLQPVFRAARLCTRLHCRRAVARVFTYKGFFADSRPSLLIWESETMGYQPRNACVLLS